MPPNPYTPGELPRVLAGREQQQDRIRGYLSRIGTYGQMGGPSDTTTETPSGVWPVTTRRGTVLIGAPRRLVPAR